MKVGLHYEMARPELDDRLLFSETLDQITLADRMGFDYVWLVEHHFLTGFSGSACPDIVYGALSQRTERIRLGLGVVVLPYHHPIQVAERVATLDHLAEGRVDMGTGRSAPYELTGMGIDPNESREMWEESLTMIPRILGVRLVRVGRQVLERPVEAGLAEALPGPTPSDLGRGPAIRNL